MTMMQMKTQLGFTLIEVLVALILFAIGMLGLAKLQLEAHQNSRYSTQRTEITTAASNLIERMRANLPAVNADKYVYSSQSDGLPAAVTGCDESNACGSSYELAQHDLRQWLFAIDQSIPAINTSGSINNDIHIQVCRDSTPTVARPSAPGSNINCDGLLDQWTIYIDWLEHSEAEDKFKPQRQTLSFIP